MDPDGRVGTVYDLSSRPRRLKGGPPALGRASPALIAAVAMLGATACLPTPPYPQAGFEGPVVAGRLGLVGHSIPHSSVEELAGELRLTRMAAFDTRNGRTIPEVSPAFDWLVAEAPEVAVVDLGENDLGDRVSQRTLRNRVIGALDRLADIRCVVWVDLRDLASPWFRPDWTAQAVSFNLWLPGEVELRSNTHVAGWAEWSRPHDEWFLSDGLYLNEEGRAAYAAFIRGQVDGFCGGATASNPVTEGIPVPRSGPPEVAGDGPAASPVPPDTDADPMPTATVAPEDPVIVGPDQPDPDGPRPRRAPGA